jgi:transcriptional regulator with XRE-family HTH domain
MVGDNVKFGKRIRLLRKQVGLNQERLADMIGISRPTLSQVEKGRTELKSEKLVKLAGVFNLSVDGLLNLEAEVEVIIPAVKVEEKSELTLRINVPQKNLKKFKEVLLYILNKVGAKPNIGETVIYKLLYFIDFDFYEKYEDQLIGATYMRNNHGPTPIEFKKIVDRMIVDKEIVKVVNNYFQYPQRKYLPLRQADLTILRAHEKEMIDDVLSRLSDMNASQISEYSHNDVPWLTTANKKIIEYEAVFYRTKPYSVRSYHEGN